MLTLIEGPLAEDPLPREQEEDAYPTEECASAAGQSAQPAEMRSTRVKLDDHRLIGVV